ncbi:hypothetical protein [Polycladidibacter stylochi]|uniref:hypothetical protein n=1 Tax=Polycladidibacter stylochi TaxID=1807766 RepID=UPI0008377043|nr:hypothetical protein [Pseudovibrio stylochi]
MQDSATEKIRNVISRPGMFLLEDDLSYAVAFLSGLDYSSDTKPLNGFHDWIVDKYFNEPQAQAWEHLIKKIPQCAKNNPKSDVQAFLMIVDEYLNTIEV